MQNISPACGLECNWNWPVIFLCIEKSKMFEFYDCSPILWMQIRSFMILQDGSLWRHGWSKLPKKTTLDFSLYTSTEFCDSTVFHQFTRTNCECQIFVIVSCSFCLKNKSEILEFARCADIDSSYLIRNLQCLAHLSWSCTKSFIKLKIEYEWARFIIFSS